VKLEWGIETEPDWYDGPRYVVPMKDEKTADDVCGEDQYVVFRYVGEWTKADE
jgi:hypothetical protein